MQTEEERLRHIQARAINEQIIEYGVRRGLLDALRLSYQPSEDGSLIIHVPRHRGHFRIQPPGVGAASEIRVIAVGDEGSIQMGMLTTPLRWDASATDWALLHPSETGDLAAEVWKTMVLLARQAGWLLRRVA